MGCTSTKSINKCFTVNENHIYYMRSAVSLTRKVEASNLQKRISLEFHYASVIVIFPLKFLDLRAEMMISHSETVQTDASES